MAKASTKTAAAKAPATTAADTTAPEATATAAPSANTAVIKFSKDKHGGTVRGAVNGQRFEFPVDSDVTVTKEQLEVLTNSGATFSTSVPLAGASDGAEAPATTVEGTAIRLEAGTTNAVDENGNPLPVPELRQITDKELTDGADQKASQEQAETGASAG